MFVPAVRVPQFMELMGVVQALFEYTPKFADVETGPLDGRFCDVLMAAYVVSVRARAIMTNAIIEVVSESFIFGVFYPFKTHVYRKS